MHTDTDTHTHAHNQIQTQQTHPQTHTQTHNKHTSQIPSTFLVPGTDSRVLTMRTAPHRHTWGNGSPDATTIDGSVAWHRAAQRVNTCKINARWWIPRAEKSSFSIRLPLRSIVSLSARTFCASRQTRNTFRAILARYASTWREQVTARIKREIFPLMKARNPIMFLLCFYIAAPRKN